MNYLIGNRIDVIDSVVDADGAFVRIADGRYASVRCHAVGKCRDDVNDDGDRDGYFDDRQAFLSGTTTHLEASFSHCHMHMEIA